MKVLEDKTDGELLTSIIAELAKTSNELKCCQQDNQKAQSRVSFLIATAHELTNRLEDNKD